MIHFHFLYRIVFFPLQNWEILILNKLRWDLNAVTPNDFLEQIFCRLRLPHQIDITMVRKHAQTYVSLCCIGKSMLNLEMVFRTSQ